MSVSRRRFMGGVAAAVGYLGVGKEVDLFGQQVAPSAANRVRQAMGADDWDSFAKLSSNENPYGPPDSVMKAMTHAFKYANRYGYPDGGIVDEIAKHHGVKPENVLLGAGSGEILDVVGSAFAGNGKKVVGVEPSYSQVYSHVTSVKGAAITLPLTDDYRQDMQAIISATKTALSRGRVHLSVQPEQPDRRVVSKQEVEAAPRRHSGRTCRC